MDTRAKAVRTNPNSKDKEKERRKSIQTNLEGFTSGGRPDTSKGGGESGKGAESGQASSMEAIYEAVKSIERTFSVKLDSIEKKFSEVTNAIRSEINLLRTELKEENRQINHRLNDVEKSMEYHSKQVEELEETQNKNMKELDRKMRNRIHELEDVFLRSEKNNRKYNLLFYGIKAPDGAEGEENIYNTINSFLKEDCKLDPGYVDNISYQHAHRLPASGGRAGPNPIIARFVHYMDRETVFQKGFSLPKGKRILSDLPVCMKKERSRLASEAYQIRQKEKLQTRIRESGLDLILETRKDRQDRWVLRKV